MPEVRYPEASLLRESTSRDSFNSFYIQLSSRHNSHHGRNPPFPIHICTLFAFPSSGPAYHRGPVTSKSQRGEDGGTALWPPRWENWPNMPANCHLHDSQRNHSNTARRCTEPLPKQDWPRFSVASHVRLRMCEPKIRVGSPHATCKDSPAGPELAGARDHSRTRLMLGSSRMVMGIECGAGLGN